MLPLRITRAEKKAAAAGVQLEEFGSDCPPSAARAKPNAAFKKYLLSRLGMRQTDGVDGRRWLR